MHRLPCLLDLTLIIARNFLDYNRSVFFPGSFSKRNGRRKLSLDDWPYGMYDKIEKIISEIHICLGRRPNGQWLQSIQFRLPILEEDMNIRLDNEQQAETMCRLSRLPAD